MSGDDLPYARMLAIGDNILQGVVHEHPCVGMVLRLYKTGDTYATGLWEIIGTTEMRMGEGMLERKNGGWTGYVSEHAGIWHLKADAALRRVQFSEVP